MSSISGSSTSHVLSKRERDLLLSMLTSTATPIRFDYNKIARDMNLKNVRVAQDQVCRLKAKLGGRVYKKSKPGMGKGTTSYEERLHKKLEALGALVDEEMLNGWEPEHWLVENEDVKCENEKGVKMEVEGSGKVQVGEMDESTPKFKFEEGESRLVGKLVEAPVVKTEVMEQQGLKGTKEEVEVKKEEVWIWKW